MDDFMKTQSPKLQNPNQESKFFPESAMETGDYYYMEGYNQLELNDPKAAAQMFEKGSKLNHRLCQKYYAEALLTGYGIEKNEVEGWKLLLKTAYEKEWDCECTFNEMDPKILQYDSWEKAWEFFRRKLK